MTKRLVRGQKDTKFICECLYCHKIFFVKGYEFRVGRGKFCSLKHWGSFYKGKSRKWKPNANTLKKMSQVQIGRFSGKKHWNWKGGKLIDPSGYIAIYMPKHPYPNFQKKYVYEHRLVMEKFLSRYLKPKEVVHHKNFNPSDNRIENLELFENHSKHIGFHNKLRKK